MVVLYHWAKSVYNIYIIYIIYIIHTTHTNNIVKLSLYHLLINIFFIDIYFS